jgi:glycosyltransferase involved in cell wall biosynthesis
MGLAVVIPVLNEAATIEATLRRLAPLRARGTAVIVVDGGSRDGTVERATPLAGRAAARRR